MKPKIAVVSLFAGGFTDKSMIWVHANHRNYCLRHGYEYFGHELKPEGKTQSDQQNWCVWRKLELVEPLLARFDYVLWIDADAVFHDFDKPLDGLTGNAPLTVAVEPSDGRANAGVFLVKSCPAALQVIQVWRSLKQIYPRPHEPWRDTSALNYIMHECRQFQVEKVPPAVLNALHGHFTEKDFIRHYPYLAHNEADSIAAAATLYDPLRTSTRADLFALAGQTCKRAAEIGVDEGVNAARMLRFGDFEYFLLCDIWEPNADKFTKTQEAVATWSNRVHFVNKPSVLTAETVPDHSLDFVYIDANHSYEAVFEDIWAWHRKVRDGGIVAGHDYCPPCCEPKYDVRRAVLEFYAGTEIHLTYKEGHHPASWYIFKP